MNSSVFHIQHSIFCRHKEYVVRPSRHYIHRQMPPAAAKAPSQATPESAPAQSDLRAPASARKLPGKQKIARGNTEVPLPFASQPVDLLGVTFQNAAGKAPQRQLSVLVSNQKA